MNTLTVPAQTFEDLQLENTQLKVKLAWYEEQFRLNRHQQFAASSERFDGQGQLFNEAEALAEEEPDEPDVQQVPAHERKKPVRKPLSKDLPRKVVEIDIADADKQCDGCGDTLKAFGYESSCKLDIVPAQVKVLEIRRLKYACACEAGVKTAPTPTMPIPKASPCRACWPGSLPANIATPCLCTDRNSFSSAWGLKSPVRQWLKKQQLRILPESKLGKAITYALNQWPYLPRYLDDGLLDIDNNAAERSIKSFVIGRVCSLRSWRTGQCGAIQSGGNG